MQELTHLSDDDLLRELHALVRSQRRSMAHIVAHLGEVDLRRVYAKKGFSSLFSYSVERLGFSEGEACRRIEAARLGRRFPCIHELLDNGAVTLTVLALLKPHLTDANHRELLAGVSGASVRLAREWLAERFPQPDVPASIRKCPEARSLPSTAPSNAASSSPSGAGTLELGASSGALSASARVDPLARDRFVVKLTVSRAVRDKLELSRDLMRHRNPSGELAVVVEQALDALLVELARAKLGQTKRAQRERRTADPARVTSATRREVVERCGLGCSFVAPDGRRCGSRAFLEFDHETPKGRGGSSEPSNVRILCREHNHLAAARIYGEEHMRRAISSARTKRPSAELKAPS